MRESGKQPPQRELLVDPDLPGGTQVAGRVPRAEEIVVRREELPSLAEVELQWRKLEGAEQGSSFFMSWYWVGTLLSIIPDRSRPTLLRVCSKGRTVALALVGERVERRRHGLIRSRALYLNETGDPQYNFCIEYNDLIGHPDYRETARHALLDWFAENGAEFDELHINGVGQSAANQVIKHRRLQLRELVSPTYRVELARLDASKGEIFPALSTNGRQQLRRAIRYYETSGRLELRQATTAHEAQIFFDEMKRLHIASWDRRGKPHAFSNPCFEQFHRLLIERSFKDGVIELVCVKAGSRVLGYLYNFRYSNNIYAYQSGFAYDERSARPGAVTHALAIRDAYRSGATVYDFLAGWNRLKQDFATCNQPMFWATIQQPRLAFKLEAIARRVKRGMSAYSRTSEHGRGAERVLQTHCQAPRVFSRISSNTPQ